MAPKAQKERGFDNAKLQAMHEPLTVRVVKIKANTKQPIEIPGKDGQAPGCGLGREDVLKLEGFIREWSGGGYYEGQVTDANGLAMEWPFGWDPRLYPEKIPPTDTQNVNIGAMSMGAYVPQQMPPTAAIPNLAFGPSNVPVGGGMLPTPGSGPLGQGPQGPSSWPPPSGAYMSYPQQSQSRAPWDANGQAQPQQPNPAPAQGPVPYPNPVPYQPGFLDYTPSRRFQGDREDTRGERERERDRAERLAADRERDRQAAEAEKRALEERIRQADLDRKEIEHKALLERQAQQHASDMAAMREEIRRATEASKTTENSEIRQAREEKERIERERDRERQAAERAAERAANDQRFAQLQEMIARMGEKMSAPTVDTAGIDKMREMERRLEQERNERERQAERERAEREREKERYERERDRERFEQQLAQMQATQAQAMQQMQSSRPDPMLELMREQARLQAETAREIARAQEASQSKMANFMVNPMEMMRIVKDNSQGSDMMIRNIVDSFSGVFSTYRTALESVAQISGSGAPSPMVGIVQDGLSHGKEVLGQWFDMQRDKSVAEAKAKQAEAHAYTAQAQVAAQRNQMEQQQRSQWGPPPQVVQQAQADMAAQQAAAQQGGMNGAAPAPMPMQPQQAAPQPAQQQPQPQDAPGQPPTQAQIVAAEIIEASKVPIDPNKLPELITAADIRVLQHPLVIESVSRLRKGARDWVLTKGAVDPKTKKHSGLTPIEAANAILQGVAAVHQNNIQVPAFALFTEQRFPDMADLLLNGSPAQYRDKVAQELRKRALGEVDDPADPELDDEDDDEDDDEEGDESGAEA